MNDTKTTPPAVSDTPRCLRETAERERDDARKALALGGVKDEVRELKSALASESRQREAAEAKLAKVSRMIAILDEVNDKQTDMEVALSASFNEAMALDHSEMVEAERDSLTARLAEVEKDNKELRSDLNAAVAALRDIANMPEYDQDDAHRLRHQASHFLAQIGGRA